MKESVLDVLMYLCNRYLDEDVDVESDQTSLREELLDAGFDRVEVAKALTWLEGLGGDDGMPAMWAGTAASRVYTAYELGRLNAECRGFLLFLEQAGAMDGGTRELVIEKVMELGAEEIDLEQLKWVTLMVLFNQPGGDVVQPWVEELVFEHNTGVLH